jgi:hypothetical protein
MSIVVTLMIRPIPELGVRVALGNVPQEGASRFTTAYSTQQR